MHNIREEDIEFDVKGFDDDGSLLLHTVHTNKVSKDIEVSAWKDRLDDPKDKAYFVEVYDRKTSLIKKIKTQKCED